MAHTVQAAFIALILATACGGRRAEPDCERPKGTCGPAADCVRSPTFEVSCRCHDGFVAANSVDVPCMPKLAALTINGAALEVLDDTGDRFAVVHLEVPSETQALEVEVHAVHPAVRTTIDGALISKISRPFRGPLTRVDVTLVDATGSVERRVAVLVRSAMGYRRSTQLESPAGAQSIALSSDGRVLATGLSLAGCQRDTIALYEVSDAGWSAAGALPGMGCLGEKLSLARDGTLLAHTGTGAAVGVRRRLNGTWEIETVPANLESSDVALAADGQRVWVAQESPTAVGAFALKKVGGAWVIDVQLAAKGQAIAVSSDSAIVALGAPLRSTVRIMERSAQGYAVLQDLTTGAGFGSDVALSADGTTLIVASADLAESAQIFERTDAGFTLVKELTPPVGDTERPPVNPGPSAPPEGMTVALADDGSTAAIGFPHDHSVAIAERIDGQWRLRDVLLPPPSEVDFPRFGSAVALSGDGTRVAVICSNCTHLPRLSVYDRD